MGSHGNLTASILRYLKSEERYAILIDGPWGSGKTYYIENTLRQKPGEAGLRICRASLYGVGNVDELAARILQVYVSLEDAGSRAGATDVTSGLLGLLGGLFKQATGLDLSVSASMIVPVLPWSGKVLVLDDLERRCGEHDKELLGYVTELVERVGCKVIFVSNYDVCTVVDKSLEKLIWERYSFEPNMQLMIESLLGDALGRVFDTPALVNYLVNETRRRGCANVRALIRLRPIIEAIARSGYCKDESVSKDVRLITVRDAVFLGLSYAEDVFVKERRKDSATNAYRGRALAFIASYYLHGTVAEDQEVSRQLRFYGSEFVQGSTERKAAQASIDMVLGDDAFEDEEGLSAAGSIGRALLQGDLGMEQLPMAMRAIGRLRSYGLLGDEDVSLCDLLAEGMALGHRDRARAGMLKDGTLWARDANIDEDTWDYPSRGLGLCDKVLRGEKGINGVIDRGMEENDSGIAKEIARWIVESSKIDGAPVRLALLDAGRVARSVLISDARAIRELNSAFGSIAHKAALIGAKSWAEENKSWVLEFSAASDGASMGSPMRRRELERLRATLDEYA